MTNDLLSTTRHFIDATFDEILGRSTACLTTRTYDDESAIARLLHLRDIEMGHEHNGPEICHFCFLACTYSSLEAYRITLGAVRSFACLTSFPCYIFHVATRQADTCSGSLDLSMSGITQMVMHGWAISAFDYDF